MAENGNTTTSTSFRLVQQDKLSIDRSYQRRLDENWVNELAQNWNHILMDPLLVSQRESGQIVVLDGQHRLAAIRQLLSEQADIPQSIWCEVFFGLSDVEEAVIFSGRNTHRGVNIVDRYRARAKGGEPVAVAISEILKRNGTQVDYSALNGYACVGVLYKLQGWGVAESTVLTIEQAWPTTPTMSLEQARAKRARQMVEGVGIFHRSFFNHEAYNLGEAIAKFGDRINPGVAIKNARNDMRATNVNQSVAVARMLREAYNFRLKIRLPEVAVPRGFRG